MISNLPLPGLTQILTNLARKVKVEINCTHVGHVAKFYPNGTADVQIDYQWQSVVPNTNAEETIQNYDYPIIMGAPVMVLTGGAGLITMPVQAGDLCMISLNDRDLGLWYNGITGKPPPSTRLHSISDAIVWVGLHNLSNPISSYSLTDIQIRGIHGGLVSTDADVLITSSNGGQVLVKDKVTIANTAQNYKAIMDALLSALATAFGAITTGDMASAVSAINTAKTDIDALFN